MLVSATAGGFDPDAAAGGPAMGIGTAAPGAFGRASDPDAGAAGLGGGGFIVEPSDADGGPALELVFIRTA